MSREEILSWLDGDDRASRQDRADRLSLVLKTITVPEQGLGFWGGLASAQAFTELRAAFVAGLYLSVVLLALTCVEQELAGQLSAAGWPKAKSARLEDLLIEASKRDLISDAESAALRKLRDLRNAYAHHRALESPSGWVRRSISADLDYWEVLRLDALAAIDTINKFLRARPITSQLAIVERYE